MDNVFVRGVLALIGGAIVAAIAEAICRHFQIDTFWGWLVGVAAALYIFFDYDRWYHPRRPL